ncbi:MAG TPA: hypothetical protein EYP54_02090 [Anaerolineales bacterium]|nr:hypothetical protein [Anaerolineales bacterium]
MKFRREKDSLGEVQVPAEALYGAQTQRAVDNFPISGLRFPRPFLWALGQIKAAAAEVNRDLGRLDPKRAAAIVQAAEEVAQGRWDEHFPVDVSFVARVSARSPSRDVALRMMRERRNRLESVVRGVLRVGTRAARGGELASVMRITMTMPDHL